MQVSMIEIMAEDYFKHQNSILKAERAIRFIDQDFNREGEIGVMELR